MFRNAMFVLAIIVACLSLGDAAWMPKDGNIAAMRAEADTASATGEMGPLLREFAEDVNLPALLMDEDATLPDHVETGSFCILCQLLVHGYLKQLSDGVDPNVIFTNMVALCEKTKATNEYACDRLIALNKDTILWIVSNRNLTAPDVCGIVANRLGCRTESADRHWAVTIPPKPINLPPMPSVPEDAPPLKVLHLADPHYDPDYKIGSNANCGEKFFCCRQESGPLLNASDAAGFWGDYRYCDIPKWTLEAIYEHISSTHKDIDFILWTGDLVPHALYDTSREFNLRTIKEGVEIIRKYFPDTLILPAIGNHEASPVNVFAQPYLHNQFDIAWLYDEIASLWSTWLPADVAKNVAYSASYVADVKPTLRVMSVNTNYCYALNWWLMYDNEDPAEIVQWMVTELQRAETDGVRVYIISHIPSGHVDCLADWSHQYNRVIARYNHIIAGIFYAHTHKDQFQLFFDPENSTTPSNVAFVAQSQTTYKFLNPGYRIYHVDGNRGNDSTYNVMDHENWFFDLEKANQGAFPKFELLYTAKEEYGFPDMSAKSHYELVQKMNVTNSLEFYLFYKNYVKAGAPSLATGCNAKCKKTVLCSLLTSDTSDTSKCDALPSN